MRAHIAALGGVLLLALAGCTGVPSASAPETVEALDNGTVAAGPTIAPEINADARTIVQGFLAANAADPGDHSSARAFLTSAARNRWSDSTATIVSDESVGTYNGATHKLTVKGRVLGTLNAAGIYSPSLQAEGQGGAFELFPVTLAKVKGQYRIDSLKSGLLLTEQQFQQNYLQRVLYFYDTAEKYLVPDLRWSALDDRTQLADWLLGQLVAGPRPDLANAVSTDTFPPQTDARRITAVLGTPTKIEIPGSSQLDTGSRNRLAAQLSQTLLETVSGRSLSILDTGSPVEIPKVGGDQFTASDFSTVTGPVAPAVYYLSGGRVLGAAGKPVSGPLGDGTYDLSSVAVGQTRPSGTLLFAGVEGPAASGRLAVGTQSGGLKPTTVHGQLSRPAFAPGSAEVWIGEGPRLDRVTFDGTKSTASAVQIPSVSGGGRILAVRLSPEGSRVALVVSGVGSSTQLYVGSIVRGAGQVRVDTLDPISPRDVVIKDVAWLDSLKLFAIGYLSQSLDGRTFETGVDGTEWTNNGISLPNPPDSVTVATAANVWVSASGYVWKQNGSQWVSPGPTGQTPGTAPAYLE